MSHALSAVNQSNAAEDNARLQRQLDKMAADWTNLPKEHNLSKFQDALPAILESAGYAEMYGVELKTRQGEYVSTAAPPAGRVCADRRRLVSRHPIQPSSSSKNISERMSTIWQRQRSNSQNL